MKKLLTIFICVAGLIACKTTTTTPSAYAENVSKLTSLLDSTDLGANYNGSLLIADGENILLEKSYGITALNKQPNQINSAYDIASMGKMFTAVAILQLIENNQLSLEQKIGDVLPHYPNEEAKGITVKQLLSHVSGLGDYFGPEFDKNKDAIKTLKDYLPFFVNDPLEFTPGERMRYSNAGYIVLGLMIEEISGAEYNAHIKKNILQPAEMTTTGPLSSSAGGGPSTVHDFHKFALALKRNTLIDQKSFSVMTTDHFGNGYGYGMSLRDVNGKHLYGHNGGAPGVSGELDMVMDEDLIIITLSNRSPMEGWAQVRTHIRNEFFGSTPEIAQFLNTEQVVKVYKEQGYEKASELLTKLNNNISDRNTFGFAEQYANEGKLDKAIDILKLIVQAYADQWHPYSFLADFQLQAGHKEEAIANYKRSLELNPQNQQALEQLQKLGQ
ncbi:MAG: serine hydrolase [Flavobacteriaceae bacterium]